uniref:Uncharacterized protein n=1 Tax=Sphaerodactylus townsendi TaxID=933632 RepID=A0ACB8FHX5_9SAUR
MYVSYLLDKEGPSMYSGSVRHAAGINLAAAAQNFVGAPQYPDYGAYHVPATLGLDNAPSPASPWTATYGAPLRDDWNGYGQQGATPAPNPSHGPAAAGLATYSPAGEYHTHPHLHHPAQGPPAPPCGVPPAGGLIQSLNPPPGAEQLSPGGQRRSLCGSEWMRKPPLGGPAKDPDANPGGRPSSPGLASSWSGPPPVGLLEPQLRVQAESRQLKELLSDPVILLRQAGLKR